MHSIPGRRIILIAFLIFLLLPIYWLVNMSFKTNTEIVSGMTLWPHQPTLANYIRIFTDESWYSGYIHSLNYVLINTVISISFALPAAYAFSRYRFLGDKHLFFWLLSNRMAPPAVFALPFFNLYSALNLFDTPWAVALAHCLFNVPLAVWILEGFVSSVPARDRRDRVPRRLLVPEILRQDPGAADRQRHRRRRLLLLHVLMGRAAAGAHADLRQRQADFGGDDPHGVGGRNGLGPAGRGRRADHHSRRAGDLVRPQLHRARFCAGQGVRAMMENTVIASVAKQSRAYTELDCFATLAMTGGLAMENIAWMACPTAIFFVLLACTLATMTWLAVAYPEAERVGVLRIPTTRGDRLFISLIVAAVIHLLWIAFVGTDSLLTLPIGEEGTELSSLWLATVISLVSAVAIFRTV